MNRAFIFPGQGSQIIGMGKDFYDNFQVAKHSFEEVNDALRYDLSSLIFNGPEELLTLTVNTQPALMVVSVAIIRSLLEQSGKKLHELCSYVAGHSLGEYSALCSAGSLSLQRTAQLLHIRGSSMQEACKPGEGAMAACLGIDLKELEEIATNCECEIANDNIAGQVVISGLTGNIDQAVMILKDSGYKAIKLKVSAPFHCSLMRRAEQKMAETLSEVELAPPAVPIICNVSAEVNTDPMIIKHNLVSQVVGRVRWRETLDKFKQLGVEEIVEIGSGKILTSMIRKAEYHFKLTNISNITELEEFLH